MLALVKGRIAEHLNIRPALLAAVNDPVAPSSFVTPIVYAGYFDWLLKAAGFRNGRVAARTLAGSVDRLKEDIAVVRARQEELEAHTVTAYLLRGAQLAGQAGLLPESNPARRDQNEKALQEFLAALKVKGDDVDALELAGKQSLVLGDDEPALRYFQRMGAAAKTNEFHLQHARALRLQAEILEKRSRPSDWDDARGILITAIEEVLAEIKRSSPDKTLELAKAYRVRGEVQMKREKFTASRTALDEALPLFEKLGPQGKDGVKSTKAAIERLDAAEKDREAPGDD